MQRLAAALLVLVVAASAAPIAVGGTDAGTHVSFDVVDRAVTDYAVRGETMLDSVRVESRSSVEAAGRVDANTTPSAVTRVGGANLTRVGGANLTANATADAETRVAAENGATITAHDNPRGVLVVASGNQSDYAVADLPPGATAEAEGDAQIEVTTENGTDGTFLVVGQGTVAVNDEGGVTAQLGDDGRLVFRAYPDGKDDGDDERERLLAAGEASAEVYVMTEPASEDAAGVENATGTENATESDNDSESENASERGNATNTATASVSDRVVIDAVTYDANTTVDPVETVRGEVALAMNRTTADGTVLLTSVSGELLDPADEVTAAVDGEAAAEAAAYSQLESAVGSEQSRYLVERTEGEGAGADVAGAEVAVGVNRFSERTVSIASPGAPDERTTDDPGTTADSETADGGSTADDPASDDGSPEQGDDETPGENSRGVPGFTAGLAVVALLAAALLAWMR